VADLDREWNTDAFEIEQEVLLKALRVYASRLARDARLYGQPCDATVQALHDLYRRQRGRCAITGLPLRKDLIGKPGTAVSYSFPFEMELDHIEMVERDNLARSAMAGKVEHAGMVAMISNLRFVCAIGHRFRHWVEKYGDAANMLVTGICAAQKLGPPRNDAVAITPGDPVKFAVES
jgi:hypothetical protein